MTQKDNRVINIVITTPSTSSVNQVTIESSIQSTSRMKTTTMSTFLLTHTKEKNSKQQPSTPITSTSKESIYPPTLTLTPMITSTISTSISGN